MAPFDSAQKDDRLLGPHSVGVAQKMRPHSGRIKTLIRSHKKKKRIESFASVLFLKRLTGPNEFTDRMKLLHFQEEQPR